LSGIPAKSSRLNYPALLRINQEYCFFFCRGRLLPFIEKISVTRGGRGDKFCFFQDRILWRDTNFREAFPGLRISAAGVL
jgi:hypothetical protein